MATESTCEAIAGQAIPVNSLNPIYRKGALHAASFGKAVAIADFTGDPELDAVILDAFRPTLLIRPEIFGTAIHASVTCSDFATYPDSTDDRASIVAVGSSGLTRIRFDSTTGLFVSTNIAVPGFGGASKVTVGQLDGIGGSDIAAVSSSGTIVTAFASGSTFVSGPSFSTQSTATGVDALDADGDGSDELSVLMATGIALYEPSGTLTSALAWPVPSMVSTVMATPTGPGSLRESIAIVATLANGNQLLRTISITGPSAITNLGALGAVGMAAADRDGDGDSDLVLSVTTAAGFVTRQNTAPLFAMPAFATASNTVFFENPARNPVLNTSGIGLADFDHDGDVDTFALAQGDAHLSGAVYSNFEVVRNNAISHGNLQPRLSEVRYHFHGATGNPSPPPGGSQNHVSPNQLIGDSTIEFRFAPPNQLLSDPNGVTQYQVSVWRTADLLGAALGTESSAFVGWTKVTIQPGETSFAFTPPSDFLTSGGGFGIVARQIIVNGSGQIIARGPCETFIQGGQEDYGDLPKLYRTKSAQQPSLYLSDGSPGEVDDGALGAVVVGPRVPDYDPEQRPSGSGS